MSPDVRLVIESALGLVALLVASSLSFANTIDKRRREAELETRKARWRSFPIDEKGIAKAEAERADARKTALAVLEQERRDLLPVLTSGFSFSERDNARKRIQQISIEKQRLLGVRGPTGPTSTVFTGTDPDDP